jgi:hypothetical protein
VSAAVAVHAACFWDFSPFLARGKIATVPIVAAHRRQARTVLGYVWGLFDAPLLRQLVVGEKPEAIELGTRCRIESHTVRCGATPWPPPSSTRWPSSAGSPFGPYHPSARPGYQPAALP